MNYLWMMTVAPAVWMVHFLLSYATASVWCARHSAVGGSAGPIQSLVAVYTVVALAIIVLSGWSGYRRHAIAGGELPHDADSPEDRDRFLGFATMLLAGLSAVATLYSAVAVFIYRSC